MRAFIVKEILLNVSIYVLLSLNPFRDCKWYSCVSYCDVYCHTNKNRPKLNFFDGDFILDIKRVSCSRPLDVTTALKKKKKWRCKINKRSLGTDGEDTPFLTFCESIWDDAAFQEERGRLAGARQRGEWTAVTVNSCCRDGLVFTDAPLRPNIRSDLPCLGLETPLVPVLPDMRE